jgi:hypothetical protein
MCNHILVWIRCTVLLFLTALAQPQDQATDENAAPAFRE